MSSQKMMMKFGFSVAEVIVELVMNKLDTNAVRIELFLV